MCLTPPNCKTMPLTNAGCIPRPADDKQTKSHGQYSLWHTPSAGGSCAANHRQARQRRRREISRPQISGRIPLTDLPRVAEVEVGDVEDISTKMLAWIPAGVAGIAMLCCRQRQFLVGRGHANHAPRLGETRAHCLSLVADRRWIDLSLAGRHPCTATTR